MDKQELLEGIYNDAFNDELEKMAKENPSTEELLSRLGKKTGMGKGKGMPGGGRRNKNDKPCPEGGPGYGEGGGRGKGKNR